MKRAKPAAIHCDFARLEGGVSHNLQRIDERNQLVEAGQQSERAHRLASRAYMRSKNWPVLLASVRVCDRVFPDPRERLTPTLGRYLPHIIEGAQDERVFSARTL